MANSTVSIAFEVKDLGGGFKQLSMDADALRKVMGATVTEAEQLKKRIVNFASIATGLEQFGKAFTDLNKIVGDLSGAYAIQEQAETQLATVMRQRMSAGEADIQAIKDLASAQQQLGVIGDEVQLAGAQQVATFLTQKSSIETLLPAMNNLLAQQKGLSATGSDAVSVANLMGKAMQGQTSALQRVGITFTEAQANVMQFGTETERAAMLAQIITDNVGDMNVALAQTDAGKAQQAANNLGDFKEQLGALVQSFAPYLAMTAQAVTSLTGLSKIVGGLRLGYTMLTGALTKNSLALAKNRIATIAVATGQKIVKAATLAWTAVQKILNFVLVANPIGIVVTAIGGLVLWLNAAYNSSESFRKACDAVWSVIKPLAKAIIGNLVAAFSRLVKVAKVVWEWLKKILGLGGKKAEVAVEVSHKEKKTDTKQLEDKYKNTKKTKAARTPKTATPKAAPDEKPFDDSATTLGGIRNNIQLLQKQLEACDVETAAVINRQIEYWQELEDEITNAGKPVEVFADKLGEVEPPRQLNEYADTLAEIGENIDILNERLRGATLDQAGDINREIEAWQKKADAIRNAGKAAEKSSASFRDVYSATRSVGDGIKSLSDAIGNNGDMWSMLTGIVDSFLRIFDGMQAVINLINLMTTATEAQTAAETGKSVAMQVSNVETVQSIALKAADLMVTQQQIAANSGAAITAATKSGAALPFPANLVAIAAGVAAVVAALSMIGAFATGGIVGGNSPSGDKLIARVNSGEMILNHRQQANLFKMLDAPRVRTVSVDRPQPINITLDTAPYQGAAVDRGGVHRFVLEGRTAVALLANETRVASKSGRRTNIRL